MPPPTVATAATTRKKKRTAPPKSKTAATKRSRTATVGMAIRAVKQEPSHDDAAAIATAAVEHSRHTSTTNPDTTPAANDMKTRFLKVFDNPNYSKGISNSDLKELFGETDYISLAPVINELTASSRLTMSRSTGSGGGGRGGELFYTLVSSQVAQQFSGLDASAKMVYQCIERAGNMGIWTKDVRLQTNIQQQALNKIFKALETRQLIKPVKSVAAKSKKLYMLYNLTPSKELTGGVWYSDLEFDHEFISELRAFLLQCVRRLNGGKGVTLQEILEKMIQAKISKVELSTTEVLQLVNTLVFDYMVEDGGANEAGDTLYVAARRVSTMCDFKWWDVLAPDFHFRSIVFEDGVELPAHEPHYHTS